MAVIIVERGGEIYEIQKIFMYCVSLCSDD